MILEYLQSNDKITSAKIQEMYGFTKQQARIVIDKMRNEALIILVGKGPAARYEAKLTPDKRIETKYGLGTIRNLSSGCKTLLNIVKHPDKVISVEECGPNVLKIIFKMDNIKIYMSRPTLFDIPDNVQIRFNDSDIVTGGRGYSTWWSKEYERREADDL